MKTKMKTKTPEGKITPYTICAEFDKGSTDKGFKRFSLQNWEEPIVWTRIDGFRYKSMHEIKPIYGLSENKRKYKAALKMLEKAWEAIKENGKKILLAGPHGSDEYLETYIIEGYMYRKMGFGVIEYGATSRLKNNNIWRSKEAA